MDDIPQNQEFDYVVFLSRSTGNMRFKYAMIDQENNTIAPLLNDVVFPRLLDTVDYRACVLKNVLYVIGGRELSTGKYLKRVLKYDPSISRWNECEELKKARTRHTVCVLDGKLFVIGGCSSNGAPLDTVETYEPILDEWKTLEEKMPGARKDHACIAYENKIILCGGATPTQSASENIWLFHRFYPDPMNAADYKYVWTNLKYGSTRQCLSYRTEKMSLTLRESVLYFVGGVRHGFSTDGDTFVNDQEVQKSSANVDSEIPHYRPLVATSKGMQSYKLNTKPHPMASIEENKNKDKSHKKKKNKGDLKKSKAASKGDTAPPTAGSTSGARSKPWGKVNADMPIARCCAGTFSLGHKLFVVGGYKAEDENRESINTIDYFHLKKREWRHCLNLGEGDFSEVDCVILKGTTLNKDFRPMRYSDCKWVLW